MATIDIKIEGNLLIVSISGDLTTTEIISIIREYYPTGNAKNVIWDLTNGSLHLISNNGYKEIASAAKQAVANGSRLGGKTAYVGNVDVEYGLMRMYTAIAEMTGVPIEYNVYKTLEKARSWIEE